MAATTWYRWTAPSDGRWEFNAPDRVILVMVGDELGSLRLVGGLPSSTVQFPAAGGKEYRVAVAERNAQGLGTDYSFRWYPVNGGLTSNDSFANARSTDDSPSSAFVVEADDASTVQPGEPMETGVRTKWWSWEAPADDLYTWRLEDDGEVVPTYPKMRVTVFTGSALENLHLAAATGPGAPFDFLLDGTTGERYWIAAGFPNGHPAAYEQYRASAKLVWGSTPDNDEMAGAVALAGAAGSFTGSNAFATGARGERSSILGRSTLWWTYEAPASGWVRFEVEGDGGPWTLTVHRDGADGFGGPKMLASDRWQRSEGEVLFEARKGVRYTIALGVRGGGRGGEFTLRWEEADDPGWLRYAGRLADGDRDSHGSPVEIRSPGDLAVHASGTPLYLASGIGLQVFERNRQTGPLDHVQLLETDLDLSRASLIWDAQRDRLLADDCGTWHSFVPVAGGPQLESLGEMDVSDDPGRCAVELLMDAVGSNLYRVSGQHLEHFDIEDGGDLRFVEETTVGATLYRALLSNGGEHLYAVSNRLLVFERDAESGQLTQTDFEATLHHDRHLAVPPPPLAITDDDAHLFVFDNYGARANLFSLEDPLNPERLATLSQFWDAPIPFRTNRCRFADTWGELPAVDVFCPGLAYAARWDPDAVRLEGTDYLSERQADRFNGVPLPDFGAPAGFVASPDDHHLYLATPTHGILTFGRGPSADGESTGPDLVVMSPSVDDPEPAPGAAFTLSAAIRNQGEDEAAATTLRFYRSVDASIDEADTEVGAVEVPIIAASGSSDHSIDLTAPDEAGSYYYGACVDEVAGESDVENNCSTAVAVTVSGNGDTGEPDLVVESPSVSDDRPGPGGTFELTATVRNNGTGTSASTTLRYYRSTNTTITIRDTEVGTDAVPRIAASGTTEQSIRLTAPNDAGTYYYGACVDDVDDESDVENNCSDAVAVTVPEADPEPDLVVESPTASETEVGPSGSFTLGATVRNRGDGDAPETTLRFYRSANATISRGDTEVGTNPVAELVAAGTTDESIEVTAPSEAGTYYYGACADAVEDESNTNNNCSGSVAVTVVDEEESYCRAEDVLNPGDSCDIYSTNIDFSVSSSGQGCVLAAGITLCQGGDIDHSNRSLNGEIYSLRATRDGNSWEIEEVDPAPPD